MFYVYAPEYYIWSLEIHYMCYLVNKNDEPSSEELKEIAKKYVEGNKALQRNFSPSFLKKYEKKCISQLEKYNSMTFDRRIELILGYWKTFDNYSLSIMYLKFLHYININGFIDNQFIPLPTTSLKSIALISVSSDAVVNLADIFFEKVASL